MYKNNSTYRRYLATALVMCSCTVGAAASPITIAELGAKNNELLSLEMDLAIAKKKNDLAPYIVTKSAGANDRPVKKSATEDVDSLMLTELYGDTANPSALFYLNGNSIQRRRGDTISGWTITSINNRQATLVKYGKTVKSTLTKTVYLTAKPAPITYGQLDARASQGPLPLPMPVPAVANPSAAK